MLLQRHDGAAAELPAGFHGIDLSKLDFRFVLVINGHREEWLAPLQEALALAMKPLIKAWAIDANAVIILNDQMAKKYGLIS